jgi:leucine dehydrogenase
MSVGKKAQVDDQRRELARSVRACTIEQFHQQMVDTGVSRAFVVYENGEFTLSHPKLLKPVQAFLELSHDFARHEGIFIGREEGIPTLFFAFVHDTRRGLSQGGLRFTRYPNLADLLVDGVRLAQGMTRKNALAGLWWGGGKGIVPLPSGYERPEHMTDRQERTRIFEAYGRFVASLGGIYYTAEDVGTNTPDMDAILRQNRFVTCISPSLGGSGNPSPHTARGVFRAMQAAWLFLAKTDRLEGVRVAVQGAGNVGAPLIELLDDAGARVWICDINEEALRRMTERRPRVQVVPTDQIFDLDVDVFAPCARGAEVNRQTIPRLKARLVCGAANNILKEPEDAERLRQRGILFVPDYVCNRMGITNCADEWLGYLEEDVRLAAERVYPDTSRVLKHAINLGVSTLYAADELADIAASELHPMLGHRGRRIIDHLMVSGWHLGSEKPRRSGNGRSAVGPGFDPALDEPRLRVTWEREERFHGEGPAIATAPISAAARPHLAAFVSPLLMDVRARAQEWLTGERPRRVAGSDHGGLALQLAVEWSLPYERQSIGRPEFIELCQDAYSRNEAAIREQLHQLGVGFDPQAWLDPMEDNVAPVIQRLFYTLSDAGLIVRENRLAHRCPHCESVLVSSDLKRSKLEVHERFILRFRTRSGEEVEAATFSPELVLGAVAVVVNPTGRFGHLAGETAVHPLGNALLPIWAEPSLGVDAELLVPSCSVRDAQIARAHGVVEAPVVFGERGLVRLPGSALELPREEARRGVLARLGEAVRREEGQWLESVLRCGRCETIVTPDTSPQLFVHLDRAISHLRQAIDNGGVQFSDERWRERVLAYLGEMEPWAISRQYWWGNEIPGDGDEVLSTWFSLAAWTLCGMGWPDDPTPDPIAEVFVDPDWLLRWVVPSQLLALVVTGRPAFRYVHVHGAVHILDRKLSEIPGAPANARDEDRYLYKVVHRPMRRSLGNVVEPGTLVRRFGADALRLGYLLALSTGTTSEVVTLGESHLRRARRAVHSLVAKVTGLVGLVREPLRVGEPRPSDRWIVARCAALARTVRGAYEAHRYAQAAELLVDAIESFVQYANVAAARRKQGDLGAVRGATALAVTELAQAFAPLCPYLFAGLSDWLAERCPAEERGWGARPWTADLEQALYDEDGSALTGVLERDSSPAERQELERITGRRIVAEA